MSRNCDLCGYKHNKNDGLNDGGLPAITELSLNVKVDVCFDCLMVLSEFAHSEEFLKLKKARNQ